MNLLIGKIIKIKNNKIYIIYKKYYFSTYFKKGYFKNKKLILNIIRKELQPNDYVIIKKSNNKFSIYNYL